MLCIGRHNVTHAATPQLACCTDSCRLISSTQTRILQKIPPRRAARAGAPRAAGADGARRRGRALGRPAGMLPPVAGRGRCALVHRLGLHAVRSLQFKTLAAAGRLCHISPPPHTHTHPGCLARTTTATPAARSALHARITACLAACDVAGLAPHVPRERLELLSRAVHLNADKETLMDLMVRVHRVHSIVPTICV